MQPDRRNDAVDGSSLPVEMSLGGTIKPSTDEFYRATQDPKDVHEMYKKLRGECLILNVVKVEGQKQLDGYKHDGSNLSHLFKELHFEVNYHEQAKDVTAQRILEEVERFAYNPRDKYANCAVLFLLSHGGNTVIKRSTESPELEGPERVTVVKETVPWYILGSDGKRVEIDNILNTLRKTCLFNKPVLVFIQACAGEIYDYGVQGPTEPLPASGSGDKKPFNADLYVLGSSQTGMLSWVDPGGSCFVKALVSTFWDHAWNTSLQEMAALINGKVGAYEAKNERLMGDKTAMQLPDARPNLRKKLFFFPGIIRDKP